MNVKEESSKVGLKLNVQKKKKRSWPQAPSLHAKYIRKQWKQWKILFWVVLQNHCRWWLQPRNQRTFSLWKKSYDQTRQHIEMQRHCFVNKVLSRKSSFLFVAMYGCESWTIKRAEVLNCGVEEHTCKPLGVQGDQNSQSILKEISPKYSLEELNLKLQ